MTAHPAPALALILLLWPLARCGEAPRAEPAPHAEVAAVDSAVRLVSETEADLVLHVSNQSFEDQEVRLTVTVDGVTVVDDDFRVEDQHTWVTFPLALPRGGHQVVAGSDSGATLRESFEVPRGQRRYAVLDHWTEDGSAHLTWELHRQPVAFG